MSIYTLEAGRSILRDGKPFVTIHRSADTDPTDADTVTRLIVELLNRAPRPLQCAMHDDCKNVVTHVDHKGYVYCANHGPQRRRAGIPCRQLRNFEIRRLESGQTISYGRSGT